MKDIVQLALDAAHSAGAAYADARVVQSREERISVRTGRVEAVGSGESVGVGIRVTAEGAWGFAATSDLTPGGIGAAAFRAVALARASATTATAPVSLAPVAPAADRWSGPCVIDPFSVSLEDKLALLFEADAVLRAEPAVRISSSQMNFLHVDKCFGSTEGALIEQSYTESDRKSVV